MANEKENTTEELINDLVNNNTEDNFDESFNNDDISLINDDADRQKENLLTHDRVKNNICGNIIELKKGYAKTSLLTTEDMVSDDLGLIHSGFIYNAADYTAAVAVNEQNTIVIGSHFKFLAPAKIHDLIIFEAKAKFEDSRKREIKVVGKINDIKVFDGIFHAVVLEKHILRTKLNSLAS